MSQGGSFTRSLARRATDRGFTAAVRHPWAAAFLQRVGLGGTLTRTSDFSAASPECVVALATVAPPRRRRERCILNTVRALRGRAVHRHEQRSAPSRAVDGLRESERRPAGRLCTSSTVQDPLTASALSEVEGGARLIRDAVQTHRRRLRHTMEQGPPLPASGVTPLLVEVSLVLQSGWHYALRTSCSSGVTDAASARETMLHFHPGKAGVLLAEILASDAVFKELRQFFWSTLQTAHRQLSSDAEAVVKELEKKRKEAGKTAEGSLPWGDNARLSAAILDWLSFPSEMVQCVESVPTGKLVVCSPDHGHHFHFASSLHRLHVEGSDNFPVWMGRPNLEQLLQRRSARALVQEASDPAAVCRDALWLLLLGASKVRIALAFFLQLDLILRDARASALEWIEISKDSPHKRDEKSHAEAEERLLEMLSRFTQFQQETSQVSRLLATQQHAKRFLHKVQLTSPTTHPTPLKAAEVRPYRTVEEVHRVTAMHYKALKSPSSSSTSRSAKSLSACRGEKYNPEPPSVTVIVSGSEEKANEALWSALLQQHHKTPPQASRGDAARQSEKPLFSSSLCPAKHISSKGKTKRKKK